MAKKILIIMLVMVMAAAAFAYARPGGKGGRGGPPPEAISACSGKSVDDACSFESPHGTISGTCLEGPDSSELACVPEGGPGGPGGPKGPERD